MSKISYYTEIGLQKLKDELHHLKAIERPNISSQIAEARDKGDLSENAEYDAAKEAQGLLELKISKMEDLVANARILDDSELDESKVLIHSRVKIINQNNQSAMNYMLVSETEADLKVGKISVDSPIGKSLLGKKKGDIVEVNIPAGLIKFKIINITR